jgi:predicted Zn-dependent peptidase
MKPKLKTLKNGLRIITIPMESNPTATVLVMVEAGTRYETRETNGLSHFLEHMCFKGTSKRTTRQITYELEAMGAVTNAFTGYDYTGYYAKGRSELFPKLLDVVSDVYLNSVFPEVELEKERGVICGEIDMGEDMPQNKVQYMGLEAIYGDQPAGYTILGPKENIKSFKRDDFIKYHQAHYVAEKTIIVVAGGVSSALVEKEVQKAFANIPVKKPIKKKKVSAVEGKKTFIHNKKTDQSHLVVGMRSLPLGHADEDAFAVLAGILGKGMSSRLFIKLREELGAGYYLSAEMMASDDTGMFEITTGTDAARVSEIIKAILGEIDRLKKEKISSEELSKVKEYMIGTMYMSTESTNSIAEMVATQAIFHQPIKMPKDIEKDIRKVTADDIIRVAKKYLKPERFHLALIGSHEDKEAFKGIFGV